MTIIKGNSTLIKINKEREKRMRERRREVEGGCCCRSIIVAAAHLHFRIKFRGTQSPRIETGGSALSPTDLYGQSAAVVATAAATDAKNDRLLFKETRARTRKQT